ncbi:MAG: PepSY domain-containing protein [Rhodoblastus sp.]|nr:MAG: PepSY domain-containing protein [Rhodoblastus sp.]
MAPLTEVEAAARALGHHKFFVQPDGGCWGVYARTSDGARIEILLDPMTLAVVRQGRS